MKKKLRITLAALTMCAAMTVSAHAGTWEEQGGRFKYLSDSGKYAAGEWIQEQGVWYYIDADGFMKTGWFQDTNGSWYYLTNSGSMVTSTTMNIDGKDYTFDASGVWQESVSQPQSTSLLADGWNGKTFVSRKMDYQITLPDSYQSDHSIQTDTPLAEDAIIEMLVASEANGSAVLAFIRYDLPEITQYDLSAYQFAIMLNEVLGTKLPITMVKLGEFDYAKIMLLDTNEAIFELYFRRVGSSMTMIETLYAPKAKSEIGSALATIQHPQ